MNSVSPFAGLGSAIIQAAQTVAPAQGGTRTDIAPSKSVTPAQAAPQDAVRNSLPDPSIDTNEARTFRPGSFIDFKV